MNADKLKSLGLDDDTATKIVDLFNKEISGSYVPLDKYVSMEKQYKSARDTASQFEGLDVSEIKTSKDKIEQLTKELTEANSRVKSMSKEINSTKEAVKKEFKLREVLKEKIVDTAIDDALEKFDLTKLEYTEDGSGFANFDDQFTPFSERYAYMVKYENKTPQNPYKPAGVVNKDKTTNNPEHNTGKVGESNYIENRTEALKYFNERQEKAKEAFGLKF